MDLESRVSELNVVNYDIHHKSEEEVDNNMELSEKSSDAINELYYANTKSEIAGVTSSHRWGLPGNYPVFTAVMAICHHVEIIVELSLPPIFLYEIYDHEKYYPGEPVSIHIYLLINIIQKNNCVIATEKGKGILPLFCINGEQVIPIYASSKDDLQNTVDNLSVS